MLMGLEAPKFLPILSITMAKDMAYHVTFTMANGYDEKPCVDGTCPHRLDRLCGPNDMR